MKQIFNIFQRKKKEKKCFLEKRMIVIGVVMISMVVLGLVTLISQEKRMREEQFLVEEGKDLLLSLLEGHRETSKSFSADLSVSQIKKYDGPISANLQKCIDAGKFYTEFIGNISLVKQYNKDVAISQTKKEVFTEISPVLGYAYINGQIRWKWDREKQTHTFSVASGDEVLWACYFANETKFFQSFYVSEDLPWGDLYLKNSAETSPSPIPEITPIQTIPPSQTLAPTATTDPTSPISTEPSFSYAAGLQVIMDEAAKVNLDLENIVWKKPDRRVNTWRWEEDPTLFDKETAEYNKYFQFLANVKSRRGFGKNVRTNSSGELVYGRIGGILPKINTIKSVTNSIAQQQNPSAVGKQYMLHILDNGSGHDSSIFGFSEGNDFVIIDAHGAGSAETRTGGGDDIVIVVDADGAYWPDFDYINGGAGYDVVDLELPPQFHYPASHLVFEKQKDGSYRIGKYNVTVGVEEDGWKVAVKNFEDIKLAGGSLQAFKQKIAEDIASQERQLQRLKNMVVNKEYWKDANGNALDTHPPVYLHADYIDSEGVAQRWVRLSDLRASIAQAERSLQGSKTQSLKTIAAIDEFLREHSTPLAGYYNFTEMESRAFQYMAADVSSFYETTLYDPNYTHFSYDPRVIFTQKDNWIVAGEMSSRINWEQARLSLPVFATVRDYYDWQKTPAGKIALDALENTPIRVALTYQGDLASLKEKMDQYENLVKNPTPINNREDKNAYLANAEQIIADANPANQAKLRAYMNERLATIRGNE